jgi:hypothetical protein
MVAVAYQTNEVGTTPPRGRPTVTKEVAEEMLSRIGGESVVLPAGSVVHTAPTKCPACGSSQIMWGCEPAQKLGQAEVHPLVWHETEWMADSFICRECDAGWIEPDDPQPINWVRPYWRVSRSG